MKTLILIALMMVGCGQAHNDSEIQQVIQDNDVNRFVDEFFAEVSERGIELDRSFLKRIEIVDVVNNDSNILGFCGGDARNQVITIKKGVEIRELKVLIFHELGHCMLGAVHTDDARDIMCRVITDVPLKNWKLSIDSLVDSRNEDYIKWTSK